MDYVRPLGRARDIRGSGHQPIPGFVAGAAHPAFFLARHGDHQKRTHVLEDPWRVWQNYSLAVVAQLVEALRSRLAMRTRCARAAQKLERCARPAPARTLRT